MKVLYGIINYYKRIQLTIDTQLDIIRKRATEKG